ncbi:MAG: division/cell wall cluster transcriptional repressor MraZ [Planctomycetota bacterium]|jgi:division/cell wall cluster transcriptional repressor MraZ
MSTPQFLGTYPATLDAEGRIQLPAALRDEINFRQADFRLMATLEGDGSVCLRERADWERWCAQLLDARETPRQRDRRTLLTVAAHSGPVKCDKQGRIRVADGLLGLIGLDRSLVGGREAVLAGSFQEIRLWSAAGWEEFSASARQSLGADLDELMRIDDPAPTMGPPPGQI